MTMQTKCCGTASLRATADEEAVKARIKAAIKAFDKC
jgi:hypothetical protein